MLKDAIKLCNLCRFISTNDLSPYKYLCDLLVIQKYDYCLPIYCQQFLTLSAEKGRHRKTAVPQLAT